jgi:dipeptidyl aminopeptidase/acylaminoacyl peptidase
MASFGRMLGYFAVGSVAVGTLFGLGFNVNLGGGVRADDEERRRKLGPTEPFNLENISGTLTYHGHPSPTIVFIHGRSAGWSEALPLAQRFYAEGYNVVLWGRRGRTIHYGDEGIHDALRVVERVRELPAVDPGRIFVFGLSLGAAIALGAAAEDKKQQITGVIADSPYCDLKSAALHYVTAFGHIPKLVAWPTAFVMFRVAEAVHHVQLKSCNPIDWVRGIRCPVLLIHGKADWRVPPEHSVRLFEAITSRKDFWLVEDAGHTQAFIRHGHEYAGRVNQFFTEV